MEIIRHLSNEELTDFTLESDQRALRSTLDALPGLAQASTEQPDEFWREQRSLIWSRISSPALSPNLSPNSSLTYSPTASEGGLAPRLVRRLPVLAWSAMATLVLLGGLMLDRASLAPPRQVQADSDHELLVAVERAVHNDGPAALEPAALLAEEMVQEIPAARPTIHKKEPTHEN